MARNPKKNKGDLERVQKSAIKVKLQEKYKGYQNVLALLDMCQKSKNVSYVSEKHEIPQRGHTEHANTGRVSNHLHAVISPVMCMAYSLILLCFPCKIPK